MVYGNRGLFGNEEIACHGCGDLFPVNQLNERVLCSGCEDERKAEAEAQAEAAKQEPPAQTNAHVNPIFQGVLNNIVKPSNSPWFDLAKSICIAPYIKHN
jgi:hypothetical protein